MRIFEKNVLNKYIMTLEDILGSTYFFGILALFVVIYGPRLSPTLPEGVRNLFNSQAFRALVVFFILYNSNRELGIVMSIVIAVIFMVIINLLQTSNIVESVKKEHFEGSSWGPSPISCSTYDMAQAEFLGAPFYPLNDRNNLLSEPPYYSPNLDYSTIVQDSNNASMAASINMKEKEVVLAANNYKSMF
jgi:hypothetical protein